MYTKTNVGSQNTSKKDNKKVSVVAECVSSVRRLTFKILQKKMQQDNSSNFNSFNSNFSPEELQFFKCFLLVSAGLQLSFDR